MVRLISLSRANNVVLPQREIISLEDYAKSGSVVDGIDHGTSELVFDDMTSNFTDLGYWDSELDLDKKSVEEVAMRIADSVERLKTQGYTARILTAEDELSHTIPTWMWGHKNIKGSIRPETLPEGERISVLLFHLEQLLQVALEPEFAGCTFYLSQ
jgi:hypothetical protein